MRQREYFGIPAVFLMGWELICNRSEGGKSASGGQKDDCTKT